MMCKDDPERKKIEVRRNDRDKRSKPLCKDGSAGCEGWCWFMDRTRGVFILM
jgi:hypothetical protein